MTHFPAQSNISAMAEAVVEEVVVVVAELEKQVMTTPMN